MSFKEDFDAALSPDIMCRRGIGAALLLVDRIWRFVGARHGLQEMEEVGMGFAGWYWRSSIVYE